jgi:hypothetical protein
MSRYQLRVFPVLAVTAFAACVATPRPPGERVNAGEPLIQMRMARLAPAPGYVPMQAATDGATAYVSGVNIVDDEQVARALVHRGSRGLSIEVWFTPEGRARLSAATSASVGQHAAVLIGGRLANVPLIVGPIGLGDGPVVMGIDVDDRIAAELTARIAAKWPFNSSNGTRKNRLEA